MDRHVWDGMHAGWHAVFAAFVVLTAVLVTIDQTMGVAMQAGALTLLLAMAGWYVLGARAMHGRPERLGAIYIAVTATGVIALFAMVPVGSLMLFILFPQIWALLEKRRAIVATIAATTAVSVVMLVRSEQYGAGLGTAVLYGIVGMLCALLLGLWITRVIEQSARRADLLVELRETRTELAAASHEAGVLAERERLAREIHDTLAQGFTGILLLVDVLEDELRAGHTAAVQRHLDLIRGSARDNLAEARALVTGATPVGLGDMPLPDALARLTERVGKEAGIAADQEVAGRPRPLPVRNEVVLLRVAQEALANVRKHARATRVRVRLDYGVDAVALEVRDDGVGFDPDGDARQEPPSGSGFGLTAMRRRVEQVGGNLSVHSSPHSGQTPGTEPNTEPGTEPNTEQGTAVVVRLPDCDEPVHAGTGPRPIIPGGDAVEGDR